MRSEGAIGPALEAADLAAASWPIQHGRERKTIPAMAASAAGCGGAQVAGARELDPKKREALLHQIQEILHDRVTHVPIYELAFIWGVNPRVEEPGINLIRSYAYSAPYEDLKLKRP